MPLKIPATLKFPLGDQLNAGCRVTPKSTWATVNVPLIQKLAKPNEDIVLQFRQPPPGPPPKKDGRGEINIVLDRGIHSIPPYMRFVSYSPQIAELLGVSESFKFPLRSFPPGVTCKRLASGPAIRFDPEVAGSMLSAHQVGVDWVKQIRLSNRDTGKTVILSPVGQPRRLRPNIHFDFGEFERRRDRWLSE